MPAATPPAVSNAVAKPAAICESVVVAPIVITLGVPTKAAPLTVPPVRSKVSPSLNKALPNWSTKSTAKVSIDAEAAIVLFAKRVVRVLGLP